MVLGVTGSVEDGTGWYLVGSGSVWGGTGWQMVVLGQYVAVLVGTRWYLVISGAGSVKCVYACIY